MKGPHTQRASLVIFFTVKISQLSTYFQPNFRLLEDRGNVATLDMWGGVGGELSHLISEGVNQ